MNIRLILCIILFSVWAASCTPAATDDELDKMCVNLLKVRGEGQIPDEASLLAKLEEDYSKRDKRLRDWKDREMKNWDDELKAKLAELANSEETEKAEAPDPDKADPVEELKKEYAKKKEIGAAQFDRDIASLEKSKTDAIAKVKQKVARGQQERDELIKACIDQAKGEKVDQALAQCRTAALDKDSYWNKCK